MRIVRDLAAGLLTGLTCLASWTAVAAETVSVRSLDPEFQEIDAIPARLYRSSEPSGYAVVILHGSNGVNRNHADWADWYTERGIDVLVPDSFTPRGYDQVLFEHGNAVTSQQRAFDAASAYAHLVHEQSYAADRVFVHGFSIGGMAAIWAMIEDMREYAGFRFALLHYPACTARPLSFYAPLHVYQASRDNFVNNQSCVDMAANASGAAVEVTVYDGHHCFDHADPKRHYFGQQICDGSRSAREANRQDVSAILNALARDSD